MTEVLVHRADTPAELRAIIETARADPRVLAFPHQSRRDSKATNPRPVIVATAADPHYDMRGADALSAR
jgi:hypothetical protein